MSKITNGGLDLDGAGSFEQQQFGTAGVEGVKALTFSKMCNAGSLDFDEFQHLWIDLMTWKVCRSFSVSVICIVHCLTHFRKYWP